MHSICYAEIAKRACLRSDIFSPDDRVVAVEPCSSGRLGLVITYILRTQATWTEHCSVKSWREF